MGGRAGFWQLRKKRRKWGKGRKRKKRKKEGGKRGLLASRPDPLTSFWARKDFFS